MRNDRKQKSEHKDSYAWGKELFDIHPVKLGGDSHDVSNKTYLSRTNHIKLVRFWNSHIRCLKVNAK